MQESCCKENYLPKKMLGRSNVNLLPLLIRVMEKEADDTVTDVQILGFRTLCDNRPCSAVSQALREFGH
jgi:hypothetical protein